MKSLAARMESVGEAAESDGAESIAMAANVLRKAVAEKDRVGAISGQEALRFIESLYEIERHLTKKAASRTLRTSRSK